MKRSQCALDFIAERKKIREECEKVGHKYEMSHVGVEYCKLCGKGKANPNRVKKSIVR